MGLATTKRALEQPCQICTCLRHLFDCRGIGGKSDPPLRIAKAIEKIDVFAARATELELESKPRLFDEGTPDQNISGVAGLDAAMDEDWARRMKVAALQPGRHGIRINGLDGTKNRVPLSTFGFRDERLQPT